jgi:hypothetical protein
MISFKRRILLAATALLATAWAPAARSKPKPPSPPNQVGSMCESAHTSSPTPKVIMAKGMAAWRVLTQPVRSAKTLATKPPRSGTSATPQAPLTPQAIACTTA